MGDLSAKGKVVLVGGLLESLVDRHITPRTHYTVRLPDNPKFCSAHEAVKLIRDGDVLLVSGLGGNASAASLYRALINRFHATKAPSNLSVICMGGMGSRGRARGTVEDLAVPNMVTTFITGHMETFKKFLSLGDSGNMTLQILPQGIMCLLLGTQARDGVGSLVSRGYEKGTFLDVRQGGRGSPLTPNGKQLVEVTEGGGLKYTLPNVTVLLLNAPAADRKGNIYSKGASLQAESVFGARAAKRNGGKVIVQVGLLVEEGYGDVLIPAELVDAVVVNRNTEQIVGARHSKPLPEITLEYDRSQSLHSALAKVRFLNKTLGVTPKRSVVDGVMARMGAYVFASHAFKGMSIDVGTGLPEELAAELFTTGIMEDSVMVVESGVVGGVPCPGVFFGASVHPQKMVSSTELFEAVYTNLDCIIVGALEVDSQGNVNVSKRGAGCIGYVGPGGFIDLTTCADLIVFCCSFQAFSKFDVRDGRVKVTKQGQAKFIPKVNEVTFNGPEAMARGKQVIYLTNVGAFELNKFGLTLTHILPGIDLERDILRACPGVMILISPNLCEVPAAVVKGGAPYISLVQATKLQEQRINKNSSLFQLNSRL